MKKILTMLLLTASFNALAQTEPFIGGFGDGAGTGVLIAYSFGTTTGEAAFFGGNGAGDAADGQIPYVFINPPQFFPYFGGPGPGATADTFNLFYNTVPLPRSLLSFDGRAVDRGNLLFWKTEGEKGLASFQLERATDGRSFSTIATVATTGSSGMSDYEYTDTQLPAHRNYYRLRLQKEDGSHEFSQVVLLIRERFEGPSLVVFPNPAQHTLRLQHDRLPAGASARVLDARGSEVWSTQMSAGSGIEDLPVGRWSPGIYILQLSAPNGWREQLRFVKQ